MKALPCNSCVLKEVMMQASWLTTGLSHVLEHHVTGPHQLRGHPPDQLGDFNDMLIIFCSSMHDVPDFKAKRNKVDDVRLPSTHPMDEMHRCKTLFKDVTLLDFY